MNAERMERASLHDQQYSEDVRIERLSSVGKLCAVCFATEGIASETNIGIKCYACACGERWVAGVSVL